MRRAGARRVISFITLSFYVPLYSENQERLVMTIEDSRFEGEARAWQGDWEDNERAELRTWLMATPAERLAWLEEAIELAHRSGALDSMRGKSSGS